jgi:hypothetical protein
MYLKVKYRHNCSSEGNIDSAAMIGAFNLTATRSAVNGFIGFLGFWAVVVAHKVTFSRSKLVKQEDGRQ